MELFKEMLHVKQSKNSFISQRGETNLAGPMRSQVTGRHWTYLLLLYLGHFFPPSHTGGNGIKQIKHCKSTMYSSKLTPPWIWALLLWQHREWFIADPSLRLVWCSHIVLELKVFNGVAVATAILGLGSRDRQGLVHWHSSSEVSFWNSKPCFCGYSELLLHLGLAGKQRNSTATWEAIAQHIQGLHLALSLGWWEILTLSHFLNLQGTCCWHTPPAYSIT